MKNLKQFKTTIKIGAIAILFLSTVACNKDNDPKTDETGFKPNSDQGIDLVLTYPDETKEYLTGGSVFGWEQGRLLGGNIFKQIRGGNSEGGFGLRINMPTSTEKAKVIGVKLELVDTRLLLENSGSISIYPEFWLNGKEFDQFVNAIGVMKIIETDSYDIIGEINANVTDKKGKTARITGFFWKKNAKPYSSN